MSRERTSAIVAGVVALGLVGTAVTMVVRSRWLEPAAELRERLADARDSLNRQKRALREADEVADVLDGFAARSLGATREEVDHALRTVLGDLAETAGIDSAIVSTRGERVLGTPMRSAFPRRGIWDRLRDEPDLVELSASVSGEADLPRVLDLMAGLAAAEWPHRIDGFRLDPRRGGARLGFRIDLTTAYLPGHPDARTAPPSDASDRPARLVAAVDRLRSADRFRLPRPEPPPAPEPAPVVAEAEPPPPPPPPFPWERWHLTGVADGPGGREAWLRRTDTGDARVLVPGDRFEAAVLKRVDADGVVLGLGEREVRVVVGDSLRAAAAAGAAQ